MVRPPEMLKSNMKAAAFDGAERAGGPKVDRVTVEVVSRET